jgi:nucleoside-diphosphate-sugar epimerase
VNSPRYLLTGSRGVIGEAVAAALADVPLLCLTRREHQPQSASHEVIVGDLERPRLGLGRDRHRRLLGAVDCVINCAGLSRYDASIHSLERANVASTRNVARFAEQAGASIVHVGTALPQMRSNGRAPRPGAFALDDYLETKRRAEEVLRESEAPVTIVRPSFVIGDSRTGYTPRFQLLHSIARLLIEETAPVLPVPAGARVDFLPRDLVGDCIATLVRDDRREQSAVVWLTAGSAAMSVDQLLLTIAAFAQAHGHPGGIPRRVDPDVIDRLIVPVILPQLPRRAGARLRRLIAMVEPLTLVEDLPSSLVSLGRALSPEQLGRALETNLAYWHRQIFDSSKSIA